MTRIKGVEAVGVLAAQELESSGTDLVARDLNRGEHVLHLLSLWLMIWLLNIGSHALCSLPLVVGSPVLARQLHLCGVLQDAMKSWRRNFRQAFMRWLPVELFLREGNLRTVVSSCSYIFKWLATRRSRKLARRWGILLVPDHLVDLVQVGILRMGSTDSRLEHLVLGQWLSSTNNFFLDLPQALEFLSKSVLLLCVSLHVGMFLGLIWLEEGR